MWQPGAVKGPRSELTSAGGPIREAHLDAIDHRPLPSTRRRILTRGVSIAGDVPSGGRCIWQGYWNIFKHGRASLLDSAIAQHLAQDLVGREVFCSNLARGVRVADIVGVNGCQG